VCTPLITPPTHPPTHPPQVPTISIIGWQPAVWSAGNPCPFPPSDPAFTCSSPSVQLTIIGDQFGPAGGLVQVGGAIPPPPPPAPVPADIPSALTLAALSSGRADRCSAPGMYADAVARNYWFRFCPYQRIDLLDARANGAYVDDLGEYTGVIRAFVPSANCMAITGHIFNEGTMCNGAPRSTNVTFTCIDTTSPLVDYYTRVPQIFAASSADGCHWAMDFPIAAACLDARFGLCGSANPSPNQLPSPSPQFLYSNAFVSSWGASSVVAYVMGSTAPPTTRIQTAGGSASAPTDAVPQPLAPSQSPIPVPFPGGLQFLGIWPLSGPGTGTVTIMLGGVSAADIRGFDAGFRLTWPTAPRSASTQRPLGGPVSVDGRAPVPPANGLLNLTATVRAKPAGWNGPFTLTIRSEQWVDGWATNRQSTQINGAPSCTYTYV